MGNKRWTQNENREKPIENHTQSKSFVKQEIVSIQFDDFFCILSFFLTFLVREILSVSRKPTAQQNKTANKFAVSDREKKL